MCLTAQQCTVSVVQYKAATFSLADRLSIFSRSVLCFLSAPLGCTTSQIQHCNSDKLWEWK